jgi:quercetin dioxygenase-like cupin family protein
MHIFRGSDVPFRPADDKSFTGSAETRLLASSNADVPVHVYHVRFDDGARTNWHRHSGSQWLLVTEGRIRVQSWGEPPRDCTAGDAVVFAPGEKHWHGAVPAARGVHLAVNVNVTTEWLEPVSDRDYHAHPQA